MFDTPSISRPGETAALVLPPPAATPSGCQNPLHVLLESAPTVAGREVRGVRLFGAALPADERIAAAMRRSG
jgi:hypothetical protein